MAQNVLGRNARQKAAGVGDDQFTKSVSDQNLARIAVVSMSHGVQNGLADRIHRKGRDAKLEQPDTQQFPVA